MQIDFYDARVAGDGRTVLAKEKSIGYESLNIGCPREVYTMLRTLIHINELAEEHCYMVALNSASRILGVFFLSKGTVSASLMGTREIFMRALLIGAVQVILCHNHPSGNTSPSRDDIKLTGRIKEAGELLNIRLADHIIIGGNNYLSFRETNLL